MSRWLRVQDAVIGSGAGGAVLAARLAEAGRAVLLLEEGPDIDKSGFNQRESDMYPLLYRDAGGQTTADGAISVLQGRCLGGSTTINMGDCVPCEGAVLRHWRRHFGWDDWGGISDADWAEAQARAMAELSASPIEDAALNRNNTLFRDGAARIGLSGRYLHHNRVGCTGSGYCLIGCAYDAKRGTLVAHLPRVRKAGGAIWCDARVERIDVGATTQVSGVGISVECERVFVCAGAVHTPGILARSGLGGSAVGKNLSLQPQAPVMALFPEPIDFFRGIPQAYVVDAKLTCDEEHGLGGFALEPVAAGPGMTGSMLPVPWAELVPLLARYRQAAANLCLVPDRPGGVVITKKGRPKIRYAPDAAFIATLREAVKTAARAWLAAGADEVRLPAVFAGPVRAEADLAAWDALPLRSCDLAMISAHVQGTCRMGPINRSDVVVAPDFRVRGTRNVYVCDASLFPTTASTHTMIPVMGMANLLAAQLGA
jgi:choline dehydrogenase-like flavoprotein